MMLIDRIQTERVDLNITATFIV